MQLLFRPPSLTATSQPRPPFVAPELKVGMSCNVYMQAFALQQDQQQPQKQRPPCAARYESTGDAAAAVTAKLKSTLCLEEARSPASHEPEYLEHCYADEVG